MKNPSKKIPEQIGRLSVVVVLLIAVIIVVRFILIPPDILDSRIYTASAIEREAAKMIKYAGASVCGECHEEEADIKTTDRHKNLSCETCHGPAWGHAEDPTEILPDVPRKREFCTICHSYNPSRPTGFPQINPVTHNPLQRCITCHDAHNPEPPEVPRSCQACHTEISRTKAVSHHALLECTVCHSATEEHKRDPRMATPTKPDKREFCGRCHGKNSDEKTAPKIDISKHGEKYLCWQCHYPHMPETQ